MKAWLDQKKNDSMSDTISTQYRIDGYVPKGNLRLSTIERFIVYVGVFFAPYANLRFPGISFTLSDFFFCLSFVILVIAGRIQKWPLNEATQLWFVAFILLFVGLLIGSLAQGRPDRGLIAVAQYFFSYMILMTVLIREDRREVYRLAAIFLASMILVDIHGIHTFYFVGYVPGEGKGVVTGGKRLATVLGNPNLAASINALTMPILLYFWSSGRLKIYFALPLFAISLVTVLLTSSNSGLFLMVLCVAVFSVSATTTRLFLRLALGVAIFVGVFAVFGGTELLPATFHKRVLSGLTSGDFDEAGTFISRSELINEAIDIISEERILLVGLGADQFREISVQDAPVHNLYLLLWAEGGLLAVFGWIMFSGVGILLWFAIKKAGGDRHVLAMVATVVAVFLAIAVIHAHMYARYWTLPLFLCFGLGFM